MDQRNLDKQGGGWGGALQPMGMIAKGDRGPAVSGHTQPLGWGRGSDGAEGTEPARQWIGDLVEFREFWSGYPEGVGKQGGWWWRVGSSQALNNYSEGVEGPAVDVGVEAEDEFSGRGDRGPKPGSWRKPGLLQGHCPFSEHSPSGQAQPQPPQACPAFQRRWLTS